MRYWCSLSSALLVALGGCHKVFPYPGAGEAPETRHLDQGNPDAAEPVAPAGELDPEFGVDGTAIIGIDDQDVAGSDLLIQPGGELVVAGWQGSPDTGRDFLITRLLPDGQLDPSFGDEGWMITDLGGSLDHAQKLLSTNWGAGGAPRLIAAGSSGEMFGEEALSLVAYTEDGHLDTGFGVDGDGTVTIEFNDGPVIYGGILTWEQTLLVVGTHAREAMALAWLTADGHLDVGYGTGGLMLTGEAEWAGGATLAPPRAFVALDWPPGCVIKKYSTDGVLDVSFGTDGVASASFEDAIHCNRVVKNGAHFLAGGQRTVVAGEEDLVLVRYDLDGQHDGSFGGGAGYVNLSGTDDHQQEDFAKIAIQADGKVLLLGVYPEDDRWILWMTRLAQDGGVDRSFGGDDNRVVIDTGLPVPPKPTETDYRFYHVGLRVGGEHAFIVGSIFNGEHSDIFVSKVQL